MHERVLPTRSGLDDRGLALRLAGGFGALVVLTFCLIVLGALVRAHDAGLACPDWPLCFGRLVPRMNLQVGFEWAHRVVAGSVALIFLGLGALALRRASIRRSCWRLLACAAGLLALQIGLGALTVWKLLAAWSVTAHLLTGNAFALLLLWLALTLQEQARGAPQRARPPATARALLAISAVLLALQVALGGLVASRYAGLACPEWPTCNGGIWFPTFQGTVGVHLLHRLNGYALIVALAATAWLARRGAARLRRATGMACGLGLVQAGVGVANVLLGLPVEITGLHSALAAALVLTFSLAFREGRAGDKVASPMLQSRR